MLYLGDNKSRRERDFPDLYPFHYSLRERGILYNEKKTGSYYRNRQQMRDVIVFPIIRTDHR